MSDYNGLRPGQVLADASVADFISSLGLGIARAQQALDTNSIEQLDAFIQPIPGLGGKTLIEMGFSPAFYHYQHADISCSMNLHLRVEESTGVDFGINGAYNNAETSNDDSETSSSSSSSGSRTETRNREASLQITARSAGEVRLNDSRVALSGADLESRLASLVDGLAGNADISAVAFERSETPINPTTDASAQQVIVSPNAVAFRAFGYAGGVIRIASNSDTTFVANPDTSLSVTRSNSVANYARKVKTAFEDAGFEVTHWPPGEAIHEVLFDIDRNHIRADQRDGLQETAQMLARAGLPFRLVGHADAPASPGYNLGLSQRRVDEVKRQLIANGVDRAQITSAVGEGEAAANPGGAEGIPHDQAHRRVQILLDVDLLVIEGADGQVISGVEPDRRDHAESASNGWIHTFDANDMSGVNGKQVSAEGRSWTLSGSAVDGHAANSPQAFAKNLANSINADAGSQISASAGGAVCNLARKSDPIQLHLISTSSRDLRMTSSESITISEQFANSSSERETTRRTGNSTVAFGATLDVRHAKQFELDVTGNSSISARLVSIPAPPEFLDTIRSYLGS